MFENVFLHPLHVFEDIPELLTGIELGVDDRYESWD
jgi:hypothetical protein